MINNTAEISEQTAFLAHEIKNPLAVIKAGVQLIELENDGGDKKNFETIYGCIDRINSLITENTSVKRKNSSDAVVIMNEIVKKYGSTYKRNFVFKSEVETAVIGCSEELLNSLFENLVKNAVEATTDGEGIVIKIKMHRGKILVSVADEGCGISEKDMAGAGELFYTTKKGGSGIGLFMCRRIAEQNGGRLRIKHNRPKGTVAEVELKLK